MTSNDSPRHPEPERGDRLDEEVLAQLITEHLPELRRFVTRRRGPAAQVKESASDLVQSTLRELLDHAEIYRHGSPDDFRRWLYRTALRKLLNREEYYHAGLRDVAREVRAESAIERNAAAAHRTPSGVAADREDLDALHRAFDQLPPDYQEVIRLARIDGLPVAAIAERLELTESVVASRLHRARARLLTLLPRDRNPS